MGKSLKQPIPIYMRKAHVKYSEQKRPKMNIFCLLWFTFKYYSIDKNLTPVAVNIIAETENILSPPS